VFHLPYSYSQAEKEFSDSVIIYRELNEIVVDRFFYKHYQLELRRIRRVYPMALKAKSIIDEYEQELSRLSSSREQKRYAKKINKFLKDEFSYSIRDLYRSEGRLLIQLIHRETGLTVNEIIALYAPNMQAFLYRRMANLFSHDLKGKYEPETSNKMTELVLHDILTGTVEMNMTMQKMEKEAFKKAQREYKQAKKARKSGKI